MKENIDDNTVKLTLQIETADGVVEEVIEESASYIAYALVKTQLPISNLLQHLVDSSR